MTRSKDWEPYRDEIMRLWMVENLTLDRVAAHMLQKHGFDRKKSQYEYILKKWKARKNIPSSSWSYASHAIEKRQAQQKKSQLQLNGLPILQSRMKRALQRNQPGLSLARKYGIAHSPERPDGCPIVMASPPALENSQVFWPKSLPWIQFDAGFHIALPISSKLLCSLAEVMSISGSKSISTVPRPMELARALFATSNTNQSSTWAADLIRMLPSLPNTSHESITSDLMEDPRKLSAYFLKSCLFQLSNKMLSPSYGERLKNRYRSLLTLVLELRRISATVFNALMAATDPTSKAIKETLYSAAVSWGNIDLIESLWRSGTDLNVLTLLQSGDDEFHQLSRGKAALNRYLPIHSSTALQFAASTCDLPMATFLIEHGAKVDLGSPTPLQVLCSRRKHQDTLRFATLLLDKGARYDQQSCDWFLPPLMEAVLQNNRDLVELLMQQGAQDTVIQVPPVESLTDEGQGDFQLDPLPYVTVTGGYEYQVNVDGQVWEQKVTALQLAIVSNEIDILAMIIAAVLEQENRHEIFEEGFLTACLSGDEATVGRLLSLDAQILHNQNLVNWAFIAIAWIPDCRIASHLLKHGAAPSDFTTPSVSHLQMAALYGNFPLIKLLLSCGFDINSGKELQFEALIDADMDDPPDIRSPLECVVRMGHCAVAEALLELGADAGDVALQDFVELGSIILVKAALLCREDIDGQFNEELQKILDIAISGRKGREIVRQILDAGACISGHNLVEAIQVSDEEVVQLLFARGADIFATGANGETVLEAAYQVGNMTTARHYFSCGGIYSSKALLHGVNRAVTMNLYHGFEDLLAKRPPGPVDEYEATGFVLSIRTANAFLINIFLGDAFRASSARSIYCWHDGFSLDSSMPKGEDQGLIVPSKEPWRGERCHPCCAWYVQRFNNRCLCSPMLLAALMAQDQLIRAMLDHGYQPDLLLIETMYNYKPATISYGVREMLMAACPMSSIKEPSWHRCLLLAAIKTSAGLETISLHLSILTCLDFYEIVDHQSYSPLQLAASIGDIDCVRTILEAGATVDWQASSGDSTALYSALDSRHWKIASLLIEAGANINADTVFPSRLVGAAACGDLEMASFLLEHGLDINAVSHGEKPLEEAAMNGRIDMAELLLLHGINIRGRQRIHFVRAVNSAIQGCHYATANLLKDHGGWDPEDSELARKPRATDQFHSCARFIYDDASLEECLLCKRPDGCYPQSGSPEEVSNPASFIDCSVMQSRELSNAAQEIPGDDLFMLEDEFHFLQMTEWSFGPYTALDRERDDMARRMLEEYEEHMLEGTEWSLVPYTTTEDNHNFEDSIMFEE